MSKNIDKYLAQYAENECTYLSEFPLNKKYQQVVIIPAYKESVAFVQRFFSSPLARQNVLFICVVNQPSTEFNSQPQQLLWQQCTQLGHKTWQNNNLALIEVTKSHSALLIVDRFTVPIAHKQGVGLARKIGCDLALALIQQGIIETSWLYSSDADVYLPDNYFSFLNLLPKHNKAACFDFSHQSSDKKIEQANQYYELALRYYVAGLAYAQSHYAFFTIGSILAFNSEAYAMVRGFPKRSAAEDFYLINKLAKLGNVAFIDNCILKIKARTSDRVPFGTGPAVEKILQLQKENKEYCYYDPQVFDYLKQLLFTFKKLWLYRNNIDVWLLEQNSLIRNALVEIDFTQFMTKQKHAEQIQFNKQLNVWFDAFKTLKFIHALRAQGLIDIPLKQALQNANFKVKV